MDNVFLEQNYSNNRFLRDPNVCMSLINVVKSIIFRK